VIFGWPKLSYLRFKHIDFYNFDIGEYSLRITGHVSGLHKWVLGMYRLEFFNWKTKDFVQTEAYITPYDTYAFRDGTVNFRKIHFRRNGLEVDVYRNHDTEWVIGIQVKLDNPKILVDTKIAEFPGISHVDTMDGKNGAYWLRRYGNMNGPIRRGVYKMKNNIRRVTEENIKTDFRVLPNMYHWQIKGMYEYKPFAYLRAIFQTKNLDDDPNEKNPRKRADMIHFSYAIEADTRADSEDLIQFIGIGKRVYKLEPVLHDIPSPNERLTGPVKFVTKDAGLYSERVVELTFTPHFSPPEKVTGNWAMYDKNFLVYGNWDGYMLDNKGKRFTVENAKGTISYGTTKF
jgi:hypothetical protein